MSHLKTAVESFGELLQAHFQLFKLELKDEVRFLGSATARFSAFAMAAILGYVMLCIAVTLHLRRWLEVEHAFAVVGGIHLMVGLVGLARLAQAVKARQPMKTSVEEAAVSRAALSSLKASKPELSRE